MLKKINVNEVISDEGFSLQITHPEILKYYCCDKVFEVGLGDDPIKKIIYIYVSISAKHYKMSEKEKNKMVKNIKEAIKLLEGNFVVI